MKHESGLNRFDKKYRSTMEHPSPTISAMTISQGMAGPTPKKPTASQKYNLPVGSLEGH
jgi:hypothetical protein